MDVGQGHQEGCFRVRAGGWEALPHPVGRAHTHLLCLLCCVLYTPVLYVYKEHLYIWRVGALQSEPCAPQSLGLSGGHQAWGLTSSHCLSRFNAFHLDTRRPMHRECGFIRLEPHTNRVAFVSAQNTGTLCWLPTLPSTHASCIPANGGGSG